MNLYVCISPQELSIQNYEINKTYQQKIFITNNFDFPILLVIYNIYN